MNKRAAIVALAAFCWLPLASAQTPEGRLYTPGDFDSIEISGSAQIRFTQGAKDQVFVEGDEDTQRAVSLSVVNGRLHISPDGSWKFWNARRLRIDITARDLTRVSISGAADLTAAAPVKVNRLTVNISGAGLARFDQLNADALTFQVSGAGDGQISGVVRELSVKVSGRSDFRAEDLMSERATVSISGIGEVKVWATRELDISVAGLGRVDYWGSPTVRRSASGRATVTDRGTKTAAR